MSLIVPGGHVEHPLEEWRPVVGYEGRYEVSNLGRVRSLRTASGGVDRVRPQPFLMRTSCQDVRGYYVVHLYDGVRPGNFRRRRISQMVLEAFVGPRPPGHGACHVNERDKVNNALTNLAWKDQRGNMEDRDRHGTTVRGERIRTAKLDRLKVLEIRASKLSHAALAKKYGVKTATIAHARDGRSWRHV